MAKKQSEIQDVLRVEGVNAKRFGIIPKLAMQDRRLSRNAKVIYAYFCSYAGADSTAFPPVKRICYDLDFGSEDTYRRYLKQLVQYGYIKVEQHRETNGRFSYNEYVLTDMVC